MKSNLNEKQKEAVYLGLGPALILAGPGSGKTTVILERIKYLIYELNISPKNILVITYTKSAATEMKTRAAKIINFSRESPFFGTFHSYFYSVLKHSYQYRNYSIITGKKKTKMLEQLLNAYFPKVRIFNNLLGDILSCISKYKNNIDIKQDIEKLGFTIEQLCFLMKKMECAYQEQKLMDYDDILFYALDLLKKNHVFLEKIQQEVKYILVDEFQDINQIQYDLIVLLAGKTGNLFVVGDDDQSIYRFRGAGEANLRRFETDFDSVYKVVLDINYRCPKKVVKISSSLISHNQMHFAKELCSGKKEEGNVFCHRFVSKREERVFIVKNIKGYLQENIMNKNRGKISILCRTNSQLGYFAELLKREKINFYIKEKLNSFYELPYIKPIIGYLMFATNVDRSCRRLLTFLNRPMRYIERELFVAWNEKKGRLCELQSVSGPADLALKKLDRTLNTISKLPPETAVTYILKVVGYEAFVKENCTSMEELEKIQMNLTELKERAKMYRSLHQWMEYVKWEENRDKDNGNLEENINGAEVFLYTFHGAKGLEFDTVFIPHLNEGSVPYGKNLTQEELEEERRMFYVALTRSSSDLYITFVENDTKKDTASRFLKECGLTVSHNLHSDSNIK